MTFNKVLALNSSITLESKSCNRLTHQNGNAGKAVKNAEKYS